ncbi:MAG: RagB/SusD family nutrient uptake outer membrane protein [Bacteroidales bacterium]|nr:RagB/SusD family nutrient uptake outer membrane protein [Bacteroidales bacterium]
MKKIFALLATIALFASCDDGFLDKTPLDKLSEDAVFNSDPLAENYVNGLYVVLPDPFQEGNISCITDEGFFRYGGTSTRYILSGTMTADNILPIAQGGQAHDTRTTTLNIWNRTYEWIRNMNIFIDKVENGDTKLSAAVKQRLLGEVYFLRAWSYYNLIQRYAGVPIITKVYDLNDTYGVTREKFDDCVDFILGDIHKALDLLPTKEKGALGRINKDVALCLKCRVWMLSASKFFNDPENPESTILHGAYSAAKWDSAYVAAKAIVDRADVDKAYELTPTYDGFWSSINNKEVIWGKFFMANADATTNYAKKAQLLYSNVYFNGWTSLNPTQAVMLDYEMTNGKKFFEEGSGYDPNHPFNNRDPRFYYSIACPFSYYQNTDKGVYHAELPQGKLVDPHDAESIAQITNWTNWTYTDGTKSQFGDNVLQLYLLYEGVQKSDFLLTNNAKEPEYTKKAAHMWDATNLTGVELNKWYIPTKPITESEVGTLLYPWFRLGEMYLNLAECAYMTNREEECRTYLNKVRQRPDVMMPAITDTGTDLWDRVVNERRVELAFEFIRYFDVRRWKVAEFYENVPICGLRTMILKNGSTFDTLYRVARLYDESKNNTNYYWPNTAAYNTYVYAGEGDRKGDKIDYIVTYRWLGKDYKIDYGDCCMNISPTPKYFPKRDGVYPNYLMPIPSQEIVKSEGSIIQNPGY